MSLSLWRKRSSPNGELSRFRDEIDRTFERFFSESLDLFEPRTLRANGWIPPLDVSETDSEVTVRAEIPGIPAKDLDISITGRTLSIAGEKEEKEEQKDEDYYRCERRFGSFRRVIDLPETIDPDKITAESDNGVVTVRVAKKAGARARQIEVKPTSTSSTKKVPVAV